MKEKRRSNQHTWVILAYRQTPFLEECIRSLLSQTITSRICIATSTPNDWIVSLSEKYGIPVLEHTGGKGITQDWNYALRQAETRYVTLAHQDDIYEPEYLETALKQLKKARHPLIFFSDYYELRGGKKVYSNRNLRIKRIMLFPFRSMLLQNSRRTRRLILAFGSPVCCPAVTYVKTNLPEPLFDENFRVAQDWEAWERISRLAGTFVFTPRPLMGHRIHEASTTTKLIADHTRSREEERIFRRFWPGPMARLIEHFYRAGQDSNQM